MCRTFFYVLLTVHLSIFISVINQLDAQNFCFKFISCLYMFQAHVLIIRRSKLHYKTSGIITRIGGHLVHETATYRCDDTRGCVMQFWPPDDEHMCSKHVEAWNKLIVKQKFCASSWLITEINVCRTLHCGSKSTMKQKQQKNTPGKKHRRGTVMPHLIRFHCYGVWISNGLPCTYTHTNTNTRVTTCTLSSDLCKIWIAPDLILCKSERDCNITHLM